MPPISHVLAFAATSLVLIAIPGPSVLFVVSRALTLGRRGALLTVVGNATGQSLQVVAVALGIGAVVERSIVAYTVIKLVGAAYLIYLGAQAIRRRHSIREAMSDRAAPAHTTRRVVADGLVVGLTNPKSIVLFIAALPQFVDRGEGHAALQLLVLGAVFPCIALVCDSGWAVFAGSLRAWFARSPHRMASIGGASGLAMVAVGATFIVSGRND